MKYLWLAVGLVGMFALVALAIINPLVIFFFLLITGAFRLTRDKDKSR